MKNGSVQETQFRSALFRHGRMTMMSIGCFRASRLESESLDRRENRRPLFPFNDSARMIHSSLKIVQTLSPVISTADRSSCEEGSARYREPSRQGPPRKVKERLSS